MLNGQCASLKSPGCSEVAHKVRSPIRIALTVTEAVVIRCKRDQVSLDELRVYCNVIGVTTDQRPEYTALVQKLTARCNASRPLLNCDRLETVLCGVETLGKKALHHLGIQFQHDLGVDPKCDADSTKYMIVGHITSGECQASTEFRSKRLPPSSRVLPLAGLMYLLGPPNCRVYPWVFADPWQALRSSKSHYPK